jgi:translation initiation factor 1
LTTIQGIPEEMDFNKVLKAFKKEFACNGHIIEDPELGKIVQLQGDHRNAVSKILVDNKICKLTDIHVHGF